MTDEHNEIIDSRSWVLFSLLSSPLLSSSLPIPLLSFPLFSFSLVEGSLASPSGFKCSHT